MALSAISDLWLRIKRRLTEIGADQIAFVVVAILVTAVSVGMTYAYYHRAIGENPKHAWEAVLDFSSYWLPILATGIAGAGIYFASVKKKHEKAYFAISFLFMLAGLTCYSGARLRVPESLTLSIGLLLMVVVVLAIVAVFRRGHSARDKGLLWLLGIAAAFWLASTAYYTLKLALTPVGNPEVICCPSCPAVQPPPSGSKPATPEKLAVP